MPSPAIATIACCEAHIDPPSPRLRGEGWGEGLRRVTHRCRAQPEAPPHPAPLPACGGRGEDTVPGRDAETDEVDAEILGAAVAHGRAHQARLADPAAAAGDTELAIALVPHRAVGWRADIARVPAIGDPFPGVAHHVEQAEGVGLELARRRGEDVAIRAQEHLGRIARLPGLRRARLVGDVGVATGLLARVAPRPCGQRAGARGVFPFGFRRQPVALAGELFQPVDIGQRVLPADADHGVIVGLLEAGITPVTIGLLGWPTVGPQADAGLADDIPRGLHECGELPTRHLGTAQREALIDGDAALRLGATAIVRWRAFALLLARRGAHHEGAGGDRHHLGTGRAIAKRLLRGERARPEQTGHDQRPCNSAHPVSHDPQIPCARDSAARATRRPRPQRNNASARARSAGVLTLRKGSLARRGQSKVAKSWRRAKASIERTPSSVTAWRSASSNSTRQMAMA